MVAVSDGDTSKVLRDGEQVKIRLYGVDTPEKKTGFWPKGKRFHGVLGAGKMVDIETVTIDKYGRTVGLVSIDGKLLDKELVKAGYAWEYQKYCDRQPLCDELRDMEKQAKAAGVGLWADPAPVPPLGMAAWWREGTRQRSKRIIPW